MMMMSFCACFEPQQDGTIDNAELATVLRSLGYSPTKEQLKKLMSKVFFVFSAVTWLLAFNRIVIVLLCDCMSIFLGLGFCNCNAVPLESRVCVNGSGDFAEFLRVLESFHTSPRRGGISFGPLFFLFTFPFFVFLINFVKRYSCKCDTAFFLPAI